MCSKQETLEFLALNYIYHILSQYVSGTITEKVAEKIQHPESVHPGSKNSISVNNRDGSYINSATVTLCPILESVYTRHSLSMDGAEVHKSYP